MSIVTKTIGTSSRDYSTVAAFVAALPANLITSGDSWVGETYNDSQFSEINLSFAGHTTDATHTITLTAASGQSFQDNVNVQTNALRSNQANGVEILNNGGYPTNFLLAASDLNLTISRIQFRNTDGRGVSPALDSVVRSCIVEAQSFSLFTGGLWTNCLSVTTSDNRGCAASPGATTQFVNCTIVKTTDSASTDAALAIGYFATYSMTNVAVFGFNSIMASVGSSTFTTCMTDNATPPTGFTGSLTYANQFEDTGTTFANRDFRTKTGANLLDAGTTDTTDIPAANDIVGTSRPQGSAWDIGAWELVVAATGGRVRVLGAGAIVPMAIGARGIQMVRDNPRPTRRQLMTLNPKSKE